MIKYECNSKMLNVTEIQQKKKQNYKHNNLNNALNMLKQKIQPTIK